MNIEMLHGEIVARLPEDRRAVMQALTDEFEVGETMHLILALVSGTSQRERQILRLLMTDIEKMEAQKESGNQ